MSTPRSHQPAVVGEFAATLERLATQPPRQQWLSLLLVALEREAIVTQSYDEERMLDRLGTLDAPPEVRRLLHHALVWLWKDEEMHAIFTRGLLLKSPAVRVRARAFAGQTAGQVGGWMTSVLQHLDWTRAPLSRALAEALKLAATTAGKIPGAVEPHLERSSFAEFCRFNMAAEVTAEMAWRRLGELAMETGQPEGVRSAIERIAVDEANHRRIFAAMASVFDESDRIVEGFALDSLAGEIADVGEYFLPTELRPTATAAHKRGSELGASSPVHVLAGDPDADLRSVVRQALDRVDVEELVDTRCRAKEVSRSDLRVAIKPSFMLGYHRNDLSTVTDPEIADELARRLVDLGVGDIAVVEGNNLYDRFFERRRVPDVAAYFGFDSPHYRLVDASAEQREHGYSRGLAQHSVSATWADADLRISLGKLRTHPTDLVYLSLGNLEGLGARTDDYLFVERLAQREAVLMMIISDFPPHLAMIDGYRRAADGVAGIIGNPDGPRPGRLYIGRDALSVDIVAGRHIGLENPDDSTIIRHALHWFGRSDRPIEVCGPDVEVPGWRHPRDSGLNLLLSEVAGPVYEFGSGRGSLFTPEMDPTAFPLQKEASAELRFARMLVRHIVGLRRS